MYLRKNHKIISYFIVFILVFTVVAGAVFTAPVAVYALSLAGLRSTIASLIISLLLECGVAPVNVNWLNQLNNAYGATSSIGTIEDMITNGLLTDTGNGLIDSGLSQAIQNNPAYEDLFIDDIFTTVVTDQGVKVATGASNLADTAINVGTFGKIGAYAGAIGVGVGLGVLANHLREKFTDFVKSRLPIDTLDTIVYDASAWGGGVFNFIGVNGTKNYIMAEDGLVYGIRHDSVSNRDVVYIVNLTTIGKQYKYTSEDMFGDITSDTYGISGYPAGLPDNLRGSVTTRGYVTGETYGEPYLFSSDDNMFINQVRTLRTNGKPASVPTSPDLIGDHGNQTYDDETDSVPYIRPILPDNHDMTPVDYDDYMDYVDTANDNTENDDTGQEIQGQEFVDFVTPYFTPNPEQPIIPDQPVGPEQPTIPDKPPATPEDTADALDLTVSSDIKDIFPFCIPFDLLAIVKELKVNRQAPVITCPVDMQGNTITIDLSRFDEIAELLRLLELVLFIVGLAVATRSLIGAT